MLEKITREEIEKGFENAKKWCKNNLEKYINIKKVEENYTAGKFCDDNFYNAFNYKIREVKSKDPIFMSLNLEEVKMDSYLRVLSVPIDVEISQKADEKLKKEDVESMFIHEIVEFLLFRINVFKYDYYTAYFLAKTTKYIHDEVRKIENIRRKELGLEEI